MPKALGATVVVFAVAGGTLGLLTSVFGVFTEPMTMAVVGMGLYGSSLWIGHRWTAAPTQSAVKT